MYSQLTTGFVSIIALRAVSYSLTSLPSFPRSAVEWADLFVFVFVSWTERLPDLWPRVFWECAGHDRNLNSGSTKVAFVSLNSSGPVMCLHVYLSSFHFSARAATPTIPSLVTCFIAMRLGPVDFISACVFCIMGRSESHVIADREWTSISTQMRLRRRSLLSVC